MPDDRCQEALDALRGPRLQSAGLADELHRLGFAYCDQADLSGVAAGLRRRPGYPVLNVNEILGNRFHVMYFRWQ